ncbi:hypothetical protein FOMPIDRAFT_1020538 [Fomitopsis schrenkii]|uniref:Uncharacterized protein n=1 Tax=Fomitopsis schrenkii TaxID=2126942 RepID=S8DIS0_FOMSC|nr:hypothetical protein FOMPIDRAFT_1020538 [Fomitopsis schrenkii]
MVLLAPLVQYGAALISALTVIITVSVAAPGGLVVLRDYGRMLDYVTRGNMAMLNPARNVDRYKRMWTRLPPAQRSKGRRAIDPPPDLEFVHLVKSGCGHPGGLCDFDFDSDFGATPTSAFEDFVRATMVSARVPAKFYLADDLAMASTYGYLWPTVTMVPISTPTPTGQADTTETYSVSPGILSAEDTVASSIVQPIDWVDLVPLMACGLFLSILVTGMLLAPSTRVDPGSDWIFVPGKTAPVDSEFLQSDDDTYASMAGPFSSASAEDAAASPSSIGCASALLPPLAPRVQATAERSSTTEPADVSARCPLARRGTTAVPGGPLGDRPG